MFAEKSRKGNIRNIYIFILLQVGTQLDRQLSMMIEIHYVIQEKQNFLCQE